MPTPFYHLSLAQELICHPGMQSRVKRWLENDYSLFLFGNTAPDVQVISGQTRQETHFFDLPIKSSDRPAWEKMLAKYPALQTHATAAHQAVLVAGYLCHLQADWYWIKEIFAPVFGPTCFWSTFSRRLYLHNVLRAYLDRQVLPHLAEKTGKSLSQVQLELELPFVSRPHLLRWRDWLAEQLLPGAQPQTVEIFAQRHHLSPGEFYHLLESEEEMSQVIFQRLPRQRLEEYRQKVLDENLRLLNTYFSNVTHPKTAVVYARKL